MQKIALFGAVLGLAAFAGAQSPLTTVFARNNGGSIGGAVYFTLTPSVPIEITQIDTNTAETVAGSLDIYVGCVAPTPQPLNHLGTWTLVGNATGTGAGANNPTVCTLTTPLHLLPGTTYPIALVANNWGHDYTNGSGGTTVYSNMELSLEAGGASNVPFSGSQFFPRLWNGSIHYTTAPTQPPLILDCAQAINYGQGCYDQASSIYEQYANLGAMDLSGAVGAENQLYFTQLGAQGYSTAFNVGAAAWFTPVSSPVLSTSGGTMGDDSISQPQTIPFPWTYYSGTTAVPITTVHLTSNGYLVLGSTTDTSADFSPTVPEFLRSDGDNNCGRIAPCWADLHAGRNTSTNPNSGLYFDVDPSGNTVYCTWLEIGEFATSTAGASLNSFQVALHSNGDFEIRFGQMDRTAGTSANIIGVTHGDTTTPTATDPGSSDLSAGPVTSNGPDSLPLALAADARPVIGTTFNLVTSNIPATAGATISTMSYSAVVPGLELSGFNMPGCYQHINIVGVDNLFLFGTPTVSRSITVRPNPALSGANFFTQSTTLVSGVNPLGALTSNAVRLVLGTL